MTTLAHKPREFVHGTAGTVRYCVTILVLAGVGGLIQSLFHHA